jgi:tetratricopeptide (TPR) repeat protein
VSAWWSASTKYSRRAADGARPAAPRDLHSRKGGFVQDRMIPAASTIPSTPDALFQLGRASLDNRRYHEALDYLQRAIDMQRLHDPHKDRMKHLSYLGLALTMARGRSPEALEMCEQAIEREFYDPDIFCNLGIVYLRNRRKSDAYGAFARGLRLMPDHPRIHEEMVVFGLRRRPTLPFLPRSHPFNRVTGRLRHRISALIASAASRESGE